MTAAPLAGRQRPGRRIPRALQALPRGGAGQFPRFREKLN
jgi:hypothetical protein